MEIPNLECVVLVFGLDLALYFLTMLYFLYFGMVMYILDPFKLEVCDLLPDLHLRGVAMRLLKEFEL